MEGQKPKPKPRLHWKAPTFLLVSFVVGAALALGHHFFNQSLDGVPTHNSVFQQQVNLGIGTAFAFAVRASLQIAVGVAYVQVFWRVLRSEALTVSNIDTLASLLTSVVGFLSFRSLRRHPVIVFLALLSWCLPFAAIIPPSTLTIHPSPQLYAGYSTASFDRIAFDEDIFCLTQPSELATNEIGGYFWLDYKGPTTDLSRITTATAYQGTVPVATPRVVNSSYSLEFLGPALQCLPISDSILGGFGGPLGCNLTSAGNASLPCAEIQLYVPYMSWVPSASSLVPFATDSVSGETGLLPFSSSSSVYDSATLGNYTEQPATIFVAVQPDRWGSWAVLNCSLQNASYTVTFVATNAIMKLEMAGLTYLNPVEVQSVLGWTGGSPNTTIAGIGPQGFDHTKAAYQALMNAFGNIIAGQINIVTIVGTGYIPYTAATTVMSTILARTPELASISQYDDSSNSSPYIKNGKNVSLADGLEELFLNMTLSLFSNDFYLKPSTEQTNMTIFSTQNIYVYSWQHLVLAYGLAVGMTLLAVVIGCTTILTGGFGFNNDFSTIMRTARGTAIDALVANDNFPGANPLPKSIAGAEISIKTPQLREEAVELGLIVRSASPSGSRNKVVPRTKSAIGKGGSIITDKHEVIAQTSHDNVRGLSTRSDVSNTHQPSGPSGFLPHRKHTGQRYSEFRWEEHTQLLSQSSFDDSTHDIGDTRYGYDDDNSPPTPSGLAPFDQTSGG